MVDSFATGGHGGICAALAADAVPWFMAGAVANFGAKLRRAEARQQQPVLPGLDAAGFRRVSFISGKQPHYLVAVSRVLPC